MKNRVRETKSVRQRSQMIPGESYLAYEKCKTLLERDGRLTGEIPLGDRFAFSVDDDWVAVFQRREGRTWLRARILRITIDELMSVEEFGRWTLENSVSPPNLQLVSTSSAIESTPGETNESTLKSDAIALLLKRPYLPILVWMMVSGAIGLFAVAYNYPGKIDINIGTDGTNVNGKFTIDGRQSR